MISKVSPLTFSIFLLCISFNAHAQESVQRHPVLPDEEVSQNFEAWQGQYDRIYENANKIDSLELAKRVGQNTITLPAYIEEELEQSDPALAKKFQEMKANARVFSPVRGVITQQTQDGREQIILTLPINFFIEDEESILKICNLEILGEGTDENLIQGISEQYLKNISSQSSFTGNIRNICESEKEILNLENDIITKNILKIQFHQGNNSNAPFDALKAADEKSPGAEILGDEASADALSTTGYDPTGNAANQGGQVNFGDPDAFSKAELFLNPLSTEVVTNLQLNSQEQTIENSGIPYSDDAESGPGGFVANKNKASFSKEDTSPTGNWNAISKYLADLNSYPLIGQCAGQYFGTPTFLDWKGDGQSFLQHDPGPMHLIYEVPYSEDEFSNDTQENKTRDFSKHFDSAVSNSLYRQGCEYQAEAGTGLSASEQQAECEIRQDEAQNTHLEQLVANEEIKTQTADTNRSSQRSVQENEDAEAMLQGLKMITAALETLSQKPRKK